MFMNKWRILPLTIADQQQHIDCCEMLLRTIEPWHPATLYWSIAEPEGLVLGFSQKEEVLNQEAVVQQQIPIYHRRAGGTAVLVGPHLLSLDVVLPAGHPLILADIVKSYEWFGVAWMETLEQLGIEAHVVLPQEAREQRMLLKQPETQVREELLRRACFGSISPYEVVVGQRKVVGLDMIRRKVGSVLQAGVLLQWETGTLAKLLGRTLEEQALLKEGLLERAVGLDRLADQPLNATEVIEAFEEVVFSMDKVDFR